METLPNSQFALRNRHVARAIGKSRLLVVDDHPLVRHGLIKLIAGEPDLEVCGEAQTYSDALRCALDLKPDVMVIDISLPDGNGIELVREVKVHLTNVACLVVSMYEESKYALRAFRAGALGYIMKADASTTILEGIRTVLRGERHICKRLGDTLTFRTFLGHASSDGAPEDKLTVREREVLALMGKGLGTRSIGDALGLSVKTIETYRAHIRDKLGVETEELLRYARDLETQKSLG